MICGNVNRTSPSLVSHRHKPSKPLLLHRLIRMCRMNQSILVFTPRRHHSPRVGGPLMVWGLYFLGRSIGNPTVRISNYIWRRAIRVYLSVKPRGDHTSSSSSIEIALCTPRPLLKNRGMLRSTCLNSVESPTDAHFV